MTSVAARVRLTAAEQFWYVLQCIAFGAGYFAKVPVKKALSEVGLAEMTGAEQFWYVLQCIAFGAGYFAKVPVKKALSELTPLHEQVTGRPNVPVQFGEPSRPTVMLEQSSQFHQPGRHGAPRSSGER
jgi:HAMP domain-containing protein